MLRFDSNRKFTILQVSDPQDLHNPRKTMLKMLDRAYDRVQPDLVIFTGDNILGNHLRDAVFGQRKVIKTDEGEFARMKKAIQVLVNPVAKRHIPFSFIYGNHDDMNCFTKEQQNEIYFEYDNLVGFENKSPDTEAGTFNIPVYSRDKSRIAFNLWCFDSSRQLPDGKVFAAVTKECLDWYREKSAELKAENGGKAVPSLIFQHIPMKEQEDLIDYCCPYSVGAISFPGHSMMRLNPKLAKGTLGEPISAVEEDFGEMQAIKDCGDCLAVVTGHDHNNSFDGTANGLRHIQTPGASFRCYGNSERGVRVFVIDEDEPEKFETYTLGYKELCGDGIGAKLAYIWDADGEQYKKAGLIAGGIAFAAATTAGIIRAVKR